MRHYCRAEGPRGTTCYASHNDRVYGCGTVIYN
jgi:hypothetical protein